LRQHGPLAAFDFLDDRQQHLLARAEVVQQHSMAGADGGGDIAK
jgi:hypothetical protein